MAIPRRHLLSGSIATKIALCGLLAFMARLHAETQLAPPNDITCEARVGTAIVPSTTKDNVESHSVEGHRLFLATVELQDLLLPGEADASVVRGQRITEYNGRTVFIKGIYSPRDRSMVREFVGRNGVRIVPRVLAEAAMDKVLSDLGYGPHFFGIQKIAGSEDYAILKEYVPDASLLRNQSSRQDLRFSLLGTRPEFYKSRLFEIGQALAARGMILGDFQFLMTNDGRMEIIDTGKYSAIAMSPTLAGPSRDPYALNNAAVRRILYQEGLIDTLQ